MNTKEILTYFSFIIRNNLLLLATIILSVYLSDMKIVNFLFVFIVLFIIFWILKNLLNAILYYSYGILEVMKITKNINMKPTNLKNMSNDEIKHEFEQSFMEILKVAKIKKWKKIYKSTGMERK